MPLTITEALAEIKLISKRLEKKRATIAQFLFRQDGLKDPLAKEGGSEEYIKRELQSIYDLERNIISLRTGIAQVNASTSLTVGGETRSIAEWLIWRREVAPLQRAFYASLQAQLSTMRRNAQQQGARTIRNSEEAQAPQDFIVNIDETLLASNIETLDVILDTLDGQLSKLNATTLLPE